MRLVPRWNKPPQSSVKTLVWLPDPPHTGTRPQELWSPAAASQRSAGGAGGTLMMSTWSSPLPRPALWTAAPANTFPTAATPTALTCLIQTLVTAHTHWHTVYTHFQLTAHPPPHTDGYFQAEVLLSAGAADAVVQSDLLGLVWSSRLTQTDRSQELLMSDTFWWMCLDETYSHLNGLIGPFDRDNELNHTPQPFFRTTWVELRDNSAVFCVCIRILHYQQLRGGDVGHPAPQVTDPGRQVLRCCCS